MFLMVFSCSVVLSFFSSSIADYLFMYVASYGFMSLGGRNVCASLVLHGFISLCFYVC